MRTIWIITALFSSALSGLLMNAEVVSAEVELAQVAVMADAACDSSMVIAQAFCTPQNCRGLCQSCGGNIVCVQPSATCCGSSVCAPGRTCLPCGGILSARRVAVLAAADSYAARDGSASHLVVVSFVNSVQLAGRR